MKKKWIGIAVCLVPLSAYAQQTYTNEDLRKFTVPGAYTNQDLKKLPPVPVSGGAKAAKPAPVPEPVVVAPSPEPFQLRMDFLAEQRRIYQAELDWRLGMLEQAYSFYDKGTDGYVWPGYWSKNKGIIQYLEMEISVIDARQENVRDEARRAGVYLEER